ncbi:glycoside hydrolase family protein, partial [Escherichia coli]|nr:glycoside hydrolase family protein [Escherichia coli]
MPKLPAPLRKKLIALVLAGAGTFTIATHYTGYWEGKENSTYIDPTGTPTICYGHTGPDVKPGMTLTDEECLELLEKDMKWAFAAIDRHVQVPLTR